MDQTRPKISVVMAAYNAGAYIGQAIESVLGQTFTNFELIIVEDGSSDNTLTEIHKYTDPRIRLFIQPENKGVVVARNRGIKESRADYIAILDADDIALPDRLRIQNDFLDTHTDVGVVGSAVEIIDAEGKHTGVTWRNTLPSRLIPCVLLFQNYFTNSSTMIRRASLPTPIYRDFSPAEDYDLWTRIGKKWNMVNLSSILIQYRVHSTNINTVQKDMKERAINQIITESLSRLDISPSEEERALHRTNYAYRDNDPLTFLAQRESWLEKLKQQNQKTGVHKAEYFNELITERWLASCSAQSYLGFSAWSIFWRSPLSSPFPFFLLPTVFRFAVKCALKHS